MLRLSTTTANAAVTAARSERSTQPVAVRLLFSVLGHFLCHIRVAVWYYKKLQLVSIWPYITYMHI
jgi:hypothetical protein